MGGVEVISKEDSVADGAMGWEKLTDAVSTEEQERSKKDCEHRFWKQSNQRHANPLLIPRITHCSAVGRCENFQTTLKIMRSNQKEQAENACDMRSERARPLQNFKKLRGTRWHELFNVSRRSVRVTKYHQKGRTRDSSRDLPHIQKNLGRFGGGGFHQEISLVQHWSIERECDVQGDVPKRGDAIQRALWPLGLSAMVGDDSSTSTRPAVVQAFVRLTSCSPFSINDSPFFQRS
jgi:hypothetical protein